MNGIHIGRPFPLGATWDGKGTNFAIHSEHAHLVELCLFDQADQETEPRKIKLTERTGYIWHVYLDDIKPGQIYGYRVHGPYEPRNGHRFNHNKLLIDPYAKAITGELRWDRAVFGYEIGHSDQDLSFSESNSAAFVPKGVVIDNHFDWEDEPILDIPFHQSIIYELHVKGFTKLHPDIPENIRGTYAGLAHPVTIDYLKKLGITAVELMPIHHFITEHYLAEKNLANYWGYNTIGYFSPDPRYCSSGSKGEQVKEFKNMVKALHKAGIEVILDVVYNHTAEGNQMGPTLSFRGIDNHSYYKLADDQRYYMDYSGTGNTFDTSSPATLRLIMDSLRYWVLEMHVDGFRFDLASALAREFYEVDRLSSFFDIIHQDPVISQVKLIAEPWDVGEGGYQVGNFPPEWAEWNGKYRDCMRNYWKGGACTLAEFAERLMGSSDLYQGDHRHPSASINFITAHDGFTLSDLVSYNDKHNEQNGNNNEDGDNSNHSWNCGTEGPTDDDQVNRLRQKQKRNFLTTLFLSQGVPMLSGGDEIGRTQQGNNNAYCQDNELSWTDWSNADQNLLAFTRKLIALRKYHTIFHRKKWFQGQKIRGLEDIAWFTPDGSEMNDDQWNNDIAKSLAVYFNGISIQAEHSEDIEDDSFYILFNAHHESISFKLPEEKYGKEWIRIIDTDDEQEEEKKFAPGEMINVKERSIVLFKHKKNHDSHGGDQ